MEQLIAQVTTRTGITEQQARQAVDVVLAFLKERLPAPIAGQLDSVLSGNMGELGNQAKNALGGLFGKE